MPKVIVVVLLSACLASMACQGDGDTDRPDETIGGVEVGVMEVTVGPTLLDCVGLFQRKCLEVNGELFYDEIEGFNHEEGYTYRLKIERYDAFPGQKEPPQDASKYGYRLIEVVSKAAPRT